MQKQKRVTVVRSVDREMDYTPEAKREYARKVQSVTDHSELYAVEAGDNRPDVVLFGGYIDPSAAERKIRVRWPENPTGRAPESLNIDGGFFTLAQLEVLAESLAGMVAELRKWEKR